MYIIPYSSQALLVDTSHHHDHYEGYNAASVNTAVGCGRRTWREMCGSRRKSTYATAAEYQSVLRLEKKFKNCVFVFSLLVSGVQCISGGFFWISKGSSFVKCVDWMIFSLRHVLSMLSVSNIVVVPTVCIRSVSNWLSALRLQKCKFTIYS